MSDDLDTLQAKAEKARAAYEQAQLAAAEARQQELDRQAERSRQIDEETLAGYSAPAMVQAVEDARQELLRAIADSDIGKAWVNLRASELRRTHASYEANEIAARLGQRPPATHPDRGADLELLPRAIDQLATDVAYAERDERLAAREARIQGKG